MLFCHSVSRLAATAISLIRGQQNSRTPIVMMRGVYCGPVARPVWHCQQFHSRRKLVLLNGLNDGAELKATAIAITVARELLV